MWDLEPRDDDPDGVDARYIRESSEPEIDDEGRESWLYVYSPRRQHDDPREVPGIVLTSAHRQERDVELALPLGRGRCLTPLGPRQMSA